MISDRALNQKEQKLPNQHQMNNFTERGQILRKAFTSFWVSIFFPVRETGLIRYDTSF